MFTVRPGRAVVGGVAGLVLAGVCAVGGAPSVALGQAQVSTSDLSAGGSLDSNFNVPAGSVFAGMTTPLRTLPANFSGPDTLLRIRSGGADVFTDDDSGSDGVGAGGVGPARGSAVRLGLVAGGAFTARVLGFDGAAFGAHALTRAIITPTAADESYDFLEVEPNDSPATATPLTVPAFGAVLGKASLTAGELDYFTLNVNAGEVVSLMIVPLASLPANFQTPDTIAGVRDAGGVAIVENDDGGTDRVDAGTVTDRGSVVRYRANATGPVHLSVRGFAATDAGAYAILISRIVQFSPCPADFDKNGDRNVSDIFAFLTAWFGGCP